MTCQKSHRDSIGITQRDKFYPVAVQQERDKPTVGGLSVPLRPGQNSLLENRIGITFPSPPSYQEIRGRENKRRAWCQQRAIFLLLAHSGGRRTFGQIFARIRRRWPAATVGAEFEARCRRSWERWLPIDGQGRDTDKPSDTGTAARVDWQEAGLPPIGRVPLTGVTSPMALGTVTLADSLYLFGKK